MTIDSIIMWIMAAGAVVGGLDRVFGNRLKLGDRFEEGFQLLGPMAISMAGIICLAPVFSGVLERMVAPLCRMTGVDPGMFGGILALDMGGYQLAMGLAEDTAVGRYAGIIVGATFGCTISFTIPMGMGMMKAEDKPFFARGILIGLIAMPCALLSGGILCGMPAKQALLQNMLILVLALALLLGLWKIPGAMVKGFTVFAAGIRHLTTIGLILAAFEYMTGIAILPGMAPIEEAMGVIGGIGVVLLGSLPIAELLQRALRKPLVWIGEKTGMNSVSATGLLIGAVSITPAIALIRKMDRRGMVVNSAFYVSAASALAAHLGFAASVEPGMIGALVLSKLIGGFVAVLIALAVTKKESFGSV